MRFYNRQHRHYCGIDLHVKTMYVCILDAAGQVLVHRNVKSNPEVFLEIIAPYRDDLVVAAECMFTWYWLADVCAAEGIAFVLGHALAMKAIHGGKAKNDKLDSFKIATLLRDGLLPQAYVYPALMRATRDLLRRRLHLVRKRGQLLAHTGVRRHHAPSVLKPPLAIAGARENHRRLDRPASHLVARGQPRRARHHGPAKRRRRVRAVGITSGISRSARSRALSAACHVSRPVGDEALPGVPRPASLPRPQPDRTR
jgi:hypothetical protein